MENGNKMTSPQKAFLPAFCGILPFLCFFIIFLVLLLPIQLRGSSDDTAHIDEIMNMGIPAWIKMRAVTWQPRFASDLAFAILLFRLPLWKVLNAAVMSVLLWIVTRTAFYGDGVRPADQPESARGAHARLTALAVFVCLFFFLVHPNVITSGSVWFTGSFYYLWPTTAMLLGLSPFLLALYGKRLPFPYVLTPICILFSLCACFIEQTAAVQIGVSFLVLLRFAVKRERVSPALFVHFILLLAASAVFFYLDFFSTRAHLAELPLFPEFANFSFMDKLLLGVNVYTTHLLHISNILFTALAAFSGWLAYRRSKHDAPRSRKALRFLFFLPAAWALVNALPLPWGYTKMTFEALGGRPGALGFGVPGWLGFLYDTRPMAASPAPGAVALAVLAVLCVLSLFYLLYKAFPATRDRFLACVLYLASFFAGILIGFSPSIWASESRPNFLPNFLLVLLLALLLRSSMKKPGPEARDPAPAAALDGFSLRRSLPAKIFLGLLAVFAVYVWILYHTTFATNVYWWY